MGFFKTPAWAQTQPAKPEEEDNSEDLFSHKKSFLSMVKQQSERQREEKEREERRKAKKQEKRNGSGKRKSEEGAESSDLKKRRITAEEREQLLAKIGVSANVINLSDDDDDEEPAPEPAEQQLQVRRSPRTNRTRDVWSPPTSRSRLADSIDVGNDSEGDIEITAIKFKPEPPPPEPEEDLDSDPEIAEWQRQARETARAKQQAPKSSTPDAHRTSDLKSSTPPASDPVVKILVTSELGGANPLILCRKLSQRLREVREMYCKKQGFSDDYTAEVFLIHRGRRYWDSTTVKRLGLDADADGRVYRVDDPSKEDVENVHVEAVTQDSFEKMKAEKAREAKVASGVPEEEEEEQADEGAAEQAPDPTQIRLTVKAKGKNDWKVVVFPTTSIARIMRAGKKNLKFPDEQNVYIEFDGERLDPAQTIGDTEIEDMYCVDMFAES